MKRTESNSSAQVLKKTQPEEFDLVILGGGTGSTIAAWTFADEGKSVAVVDRKYIGGFCPNIACLPRRSLQVGHPFDNSQITGNPEIIDSSVGLVPRSALVLIDGPTPVCEKFAIYPGKNPQKRSITTFFELRRLVSSLP